MYENSLDQLQWEVGPNDHRLSIVVLIDLQVELLAKHDISIYENWAKNTDDR